MSIVLQGSTSGSITLQEPAVAGSTVLDLPATSGTLITTGSTGQVIPKAALPTGSVLQVVQGTSTSQVTITTNTYTDTGLSASITPTSATSKILVFVNQVVYASRNAATVGHGVNIIRNSTTIFTPISDVAGPYDVYISATNASAVELSGRHTITYLDSPATTSALTYKTQCRPYQAGVIYIQGTSYITLMEIAA